MNEEILCIINKGKTVKTEWENVTDFLRALYSLYKKLGQFFFHTYSLTSSNKKFCSVKRYKYLIKLIR